MVKDKIKKYTVSIMRDLKKQGIALAPYSKNDEENCLFTLAVGKYVKGK
jgi:hypothetical protein